MRFSLIVTVLMVSFFAIFIPSSVHADTNSFKFSNFSADYYLSKDKEGHSTMRVVEELTAEFPNYNQNKGIIRSVPNTYDGHLVSFKLISLTRNGQAEPIYRQYDDNGHTVIETGTNDYVSGTQKYVFTYTLKNVTKNFGDHQELYWDTNGTGWSQQFDKLSVRIHLDDSTKKLLNGQTACYQGLQGSTEKCDDGKVSGNIISFTASRALTASENLTFVIGFKSNAFKAYQATLSDLLIYLPLDITVLFIALSLLAIIFIKIYYGRSSSRKNIIVAEYLPPKDVSAMLSADIVSKMKKAFAAQIVDLAVRGKIRIIESHKKILFIDRIKYSLEILSIDDLNNDEMFFIKTLFDNPIVGSTHIINNKSPLTAMQIVLLYKSIRESAENQGYRIKKIIPTKVKNILMITTALLFFALLCELLAYDNLIGFGIVLLIIFMIVVPTACKQSTDGYSGGFRSIRPLTDKGSELRNYLTGFKLYIDLAEADRLRVLQSPQGADKTPIDPDNSTQIVKLYERALPYAILFNKEKEWSKKLGYYYENSNTSPSWFRNPSGFNVTKFVSSINSFSNSMNASNSSSSGLNGGGFSGGGGGGGGGGGR